MAQHQNEASLVTIGVSDYISTSHFPILFAQEKGFYQEEGVNVRVLAFEQAAKVLLALKNEEIHLGSVGAHHPLSVFPAWKGAKLVMAVGQCTPWTLVLRADSPIQQGDFTGLRNLKLGAAPEPGKAFLYILKMAGVDAAEARIQIVPVPGALQPGACTGVAAAEALGAGKIDGFWANELGAALALHWKVGKLFLDIRHGDGPRGAHFVSFTALVATEKIIVNHSQKIGGVIRAIAKAQRGLRDSPSSCKPVAEKLFPKEAALVVPGILKANKQFYYAGITRQAIDHLHRFAKEIGLLPADVPYERAVAVQFAGDWDSAQ